MEMKILSGGATGAAGAAGTGKGGKRKRVPEHFPHMSVRPMQAAAIEEIKKAWDNGYRFVFLEAPAGFGKSAVGITLARQRPDAYILVATKTLQDQYAREGAYKTISVMGRANFDCILSSGDAGSGSGRTCEHGQCLVGKECKHKPRRPSEDSVPDGSVKLADANKDELWIDKGVEVCEYWKQKCDALNHKYPVMNYSYFLGETMYAKDFGKRSIMICDEAHNMEDELMRFIEFTMSDKDLKMINSRIPDGDMPVEDWIEQISEWKANLSLELKTTMEKAKQGKGGNDTLAKMKRLEEKVEKCGFVTDELSSDSENWVIEFGEKLGSKSVTFRPIFVRRWTEKFFTMADRFLLQSATIIDAKAMAAGLGIVEESCMFIRTGMEFAPEKRPIYYAPVGKMTKDEIDSNLPKMLSEIEGLMEKYPGKKGVIHTHTYRIQEYLLKNLKSKRVIANRSDAPFERNSIIRKFIHSKEPLVLITPSAYEGMDFRDDMCRWQVICKVPYPNLGNKQVRMRMELDNRWYQWKTVLRLVQTYGRGTRSKDDWCDTYLLDKSFETLARFNRELFPEWFKEAVVSE